MPLPADLTFAGDGVWLSEFRLLPSDPSWHATRRTTDDAVLIAFPRTSVAIRHESRGEVVADPMSAVVYGPGQPYRRRLVSSAGDACTILAIAPELVREADEHLDIGASRSAGRFPFAAASIGRDEYLAVQRIRGLVEIDDFDRRESLREELLWLLGRVIEVGYRESGVNPSTTGSARAHVELVNAAREELGRELAEPCSLGELSSRLAVSPFHLAHVFRSVTGTSIHAYRIELRLRSSLSLIADGVRLADVAQELGFVSHAHLTDRFVRAYGTTPSRWRESSKNMEAFAWSRAVS